MYHSIRSFEWIHLTIFRLTRRWYRDGNTRRITCWNIWWWTIAIIIGGWGGIRWWTIAIIIGRWYQKTII
ncbi:hypothetical protein COF46_26345 [Bacillus pseudomycoides]|nr:hypothetical protein COL70_16455 [Bacillus pseudomycoides]PHD06069.1 hypothetical protein COF46_26345 [Bacillus pseudomycoides]